MTDVTINADPVKNAAIAAGVTFTFYAMPDFIRSKTLRFFGKTALLAVSSAQITQSDAAQWNDSIKDVQSFLEDADADELTTTAGVVAAVGSVAVASVVVGENTIFNRAEKKRAKGKKLSHTKQALVLAALTGGLLYALESADIS